MNTAKTTLPIYLDYASTAPLDPKVRDAMLVLMGNDAFFGNPAATTHRYGWQAQEALEQARMQLAQAIDADPMGVFFTSGATESINLALKGLVWGFKRGLAPNPRGVSDEALPHVITSAAEHKATLDALAYLAAEKCISLTVLKPSEQGIISLEQVVDAVLPETVLVSLLHVNNELGVMNPIAGIGKWCRAQNIWLHVDAVQSMGKTPVSLADWGADLVSFSGHKAYGPKGVGVLYIADALRGALVPLCHGGGQERGLLPGTMPVHQAVGMATAFELAAAQQQEEALKYQTWRDQFLQGLSHLSGWVLHGQGAPCVANILSLGFHDVDGETLMLSLKDIAVSSGSACNSVTLDPSHVLTACGINRELAASTLRLSFGRFSSLEQLQAAAAHICKVVPKIRR